MNTTDEFFRNLAVRAVDPKYKAERELESENNKLRQKIRKLRQELSTLKRCLNLHPVDLGEEIEDGEYLCLCRNWGGPALSILKFPHDGWIFEDVIRAWGPITLPPEKEEK